MNKELNPQQKLAVEAPSGPLLIVAGAGTGKTKTLTSRITHFIENGVSPAHICALTFTNKAAKEMLDRVTGASGGRKHGREEGVPLISTFHSLGARILRAEARRAERGTNFVIFDDHDAISLIKKIVRKLDRDENEKKEGFAFFAQKISRIKNGVLGTEDLESSRRKEDATILSVFQKYEGALQENNAFDFDDLIQKVVRLFSDHPDVLEKYRKKIRYILVDEYQDLNPMQYELIRLLAQNHKNISVVGDDHQMIYGWRYANLELFLGFESDWPETNVVVLEENYRSTGNIIEAASAIIQNNQKQKPKRLWTKNEPGAPIRLVEVADEDAEAGWIAEEIVSAPPLREKNASGSIAILYRTNAQSRAIEQALIQHQIPYHIFGGLKFYERREIKDIVAALRYAENEKDGVSRERLEKNLPKKKFLELLDALSHKKASPLTLINIFLKTTDYLSWIEKNFVNADERRENIGELINFASQFDNLSPFLEQISLVQSTDSPSRGDRQNIMDKGQKVLENKGKTPVALMTIHLAKGLEFDRVYLAGCSEGLLPHGRSLGDESQLEEERRLIYVAMTRARKELSISFYDIPSRFLSEIPSDTIEFKNFISDKQEFADDEERYVSLD